MSIFGFVLIAAIWEQSDTTFHFWQEKRLKKTQCNFVTVVSNVLTYSCNDLTYDRKDNVMSAKKKSKKVRIAFYIDDDLLEAYEKVAQDDERELSDTLRLALKLALEGVRERIKRANEVDVLPGKILAA